DRRCRLLSASAIRPVQHSAPLWLSMIARPHEVGLSIPGELIPRAGVWLEPGITPCVKTHTSAKCRKNNSPTRHRTPRAQYDLTLRYGIDPKCFYMSGECWSFHTTKTLTGHDRTAFASMHA